jgi:hypothetical protein
MREEHLPQLDEADVAAQKLALRPLRAVEEDALASAPYERGRRSALCRRRRPGRAEEDDVEVHRRRF